MSTQHPGGFITKNIVNATSGVWTIDQAAQAASANNWPHPGKLSELYDPYWSNVALYLPMDGSNGGTTFTDVSSAPKACTANGNVQTSTSSPKFGTAKALFDGTGDYISVATDSSFDCGTLDFTIEFWFNMTSNSQYQTLLTSTDYFSDIIIRKQLGGDGLTLFLAGSNHGTTADVFTGLYGAWHHFALVRAGSTVKFYIDGVANATSFTNSGAFYPNGALQIGCPSAYPDEGFIGGMDDFRFTKGIARYTNNFTVPSAAFPTTGPAVGLPYGGTTTTDGSYTVHKFTTTGANDFISYGGLTADYLIVGAGGGGGSSFAGGAPGAGGGAGGYKYSTAASLTRQTYTASVGAKGTGATASGGVGGTGGASSFYGVTAGGGGGGGGYTGVATKDGGGNGVNGGSGGGAVYQAAAGTGYGGGYNGGNDLNSGNPAYGGSGGGGSSAAGGYPASNQVGGDGGIGTLNSITGTPSYYAAGGGGGTYSYGASQTPGAGGSSIGGAGGNGLTPSNGANAVASTGSGGGGAGTNASTSRAGGNGSDGVIAVRYLTPTTTYATWNPSDKDAAVALSAGNLTATVTGYKIGRATVGKSNGRWYWEITPEDGDVNTGIATASASLTNFLGYDSNAVGYWGFDAANAGLYKGNTKVLALPAFSGGTIGFGLDQTDGVLYVFKDNVLVGKYAHGLSGTVYPAASQYTNSGNVAYQIANFGQNPLKYTPPNGTFWNPKDMDSSNSIANNNLTLIGGATANGWCRTNTSKATGKWFAEIKLNTNAGCMVGIGKSTAAAAYPGLDANGYGYYNNGNKYNLGNQGAYGATFTSGNTIGVAFDATAGTLEFFKDGVSQGVAFTGISGTFFLMIGSGTSGAFNATINTGASPFKYAIPTGFAPWDNTTYNAGVY